MFFRSTKTAPLKSLVREKIVALYDEVFFICEDGKERVLINTDEFWEQLLILKINIPELVTRLGKLTSPDIGLLILRKCASVTATSVTQEETVRSTNGLSTASIVMRCLGYPSKLLHDADVTKSVSSLTNSAFMVLGNDNVSPLCKKAAIAWMLCLLASDEHLGASKHITSALEALESSTESQQHAVTTILRLLSNPTTRFQFGIDAVTIFSLFIQLPGIENQFPAQFSILDDEAAINAMAQIIDGELSGANVVWRDRLRQQQSRGMWSSLSSAIAGLLVGGDDLPPATTLQPGLLLAFFYATILNRHFMPTLTQTYPIAGGPTPQSSPAANTQSNEAIQPSAVTSDSDPNASPPVTPVKNSPNAVGSVSNDDGGVSVTPRTTTAPDTSKLGSPAAEPTTPASESHQLPGNLLLTVIEYTSALLQDTRDEARRHAAHVCLMALEAIAEDPYANFVLHDDNLAFRPVIHRIQLRHRRPQAQPAPPRPLASALLDLAIEFICTHLMKNFPFELHYHSLSIVHRLLCYEKKAGIRLKVDWHELWSALTALMRFVTANETALTSAQQKLQLNEDEAQPCSLASNIFSLVHLAVTILNMFITFGDAILSDPISYDDLYYEIIRNADLFANIYQLCLRTCSSPQSLSPSPSRAFMMKQGSSQNMITEETGSETASVHNNNNNGNKTGGSHSPPSLNGGDSSPGAARAASVLQNIRAIIAHYSPLVDDLTEKRGASFVTEADILELVRGHYDTLMLRVIDGTDTFDRFRGQALAPIACRASLIALGDAQLADIRRRYSSPTPPIPNTDTLVSTPSSP